MLTTNHHEGIDTMTVNLTKALPTDIAILLAIGTPSAAHRYPETRAALRHEGVPFNTRLELRTAWAETLGYTTPLVPAGTWASRLVSESTTWGMHGVGPIMGPDDEPSLESFR